MRRAVSTGIGLCQLLVAFVAFASVHRPDCGSSGKPDLIARCIGDAEKERPVRYAQYLVTVGLGACGVLSLVVADRQSRSTRH